MKHIFIINPCAGITNKVADTIKKIEGLLSPEKYLIHETTSQDDAENFVKEYLLNNTDKVRFYACGGDGTLNGVINGAAQHDNAEVACYPIGSGNDFLKYFGGLDKFLDLNKLINGNTVQSDLIKYNDKYCINVFNAGFDGGVAYRQKSLKRLPLVSGPMAYNLSVIVSIFGRINNYVRLIVDGNEIYNGKSALVAVANGICYGGGYYCAPQAKINDGLIDVCLIKKVNVFQLASLIKSYKKGAFLEEEKAKDFFVYLQGKHIELEFKKKVYASNDGEITKIDRAVLDIVPNAINFVIPNED